MTTRTPKIERAIVMLDQSAGELREENGTLLGLDLWPEARTALLAARANKLDVTLVAPTSLDHAAIASLSDWAGGIKVAPVSEALRFGDGRRRITGLSRQAPATALVSADRKLRGEAHRAGLYPAPHIALLPMMMQGGSPEAVRIVGPRETLQRLGLREDVIPMHFQPANGKDWALIALVSADVPLLAAMNRVEVSRLPYEPTTEDLVWARIDEDSEEVRKALSQRTILHAEAGQVLIALGPDEDAQALHVHGSHGHSELLVPDPNLLRPANRYSEASDSIDLSALPEGILEPIVRNEAERNTIRMLRPRCSAVTASYENDLDRYTGVASLDADGSLISRHSAHADNKRAEAALLADLEAIGYCAYRHDFTHAGQTHSNIIADLPGAGVLRVKPEILECYLRILRDTPLPIPPDQWKREMQELADTDRFQEMVFEDLSDAELRLRVEKLFRLHPWYPWWKKPCPIAGYGSDLVVVGCHLDSTAGFEPGYSPATDPAPGRDDDGSGVAAVLSLARHLWPLRGKLTHTVRFCFFNAEESGLVGSKAYAAKMKSLNAPIRAVICMDMIGYNSDPNRLFEIHAGYTDPAIRDLSIPLADRLANAAASQGALAPAQIYLGTSWNGAPDRTLYDGAINRSDHAAFHQQGYGAVLVSEDFFANLGAEPTADPNPNYHREADTSVDLDYARSIVCTARQAIVDLAL
ncbi:M20/M25/M40 family metallo-hydrolase [Mesorhizobium sp. M0698]|uniref:M28 family metallopeptidase n=1 Tax=Mesorhizobium sp. M0698 TaxID=2956987 RepID=UPI00333C3C07